MELRLGFMHKRELAEFFGKKPGTFMNHKPIFMKYCKILEDYAVFEQVRGGVNITEILDDSPFDNIVFDLDRGIKEAIEKAPSSRYITNGKIFTSSGILQYIIDTQATESERETIMADGKMFERYQRRVAYRVRKITLLDEDALMNYWACMATDKQMSLPAGRMIIPLLKNKGKRGLEDYAELTEQDKQLLTELLADEEENDEQHTKLAAYHLLDNAEYYKGSEKEFYAEAKRVCKPFYRAMQRFNDLREQCYLSNGTMCTSEERG